MITKDNVIKLLGTDELIVQSYAYSRKSSRFWVIMSPMTIKLSNDFIINIPKYFYYDMATIPTFLWSIIRPYDDALIAYLIHDYLYINQRKHNMTRYEVDREMLFWAKITKPKRLSNFLRYYFVRLFGWLWWKKII